jgi:hypothetical protein
VVVEIPQSAILFTFTNLIVEIFIKKGDPTFGPLYVKQLSKS